MVSNQIIILKAKDQWNAEAALAFEEEWYKLVSTIDNNLWGHIALLDDGDLNTPDVEPIIRRMVVWSIEHNMTHVAQVFSPSFLKKHELAKMIDDKNLPFTKNIFTTPDEAIDWLNTEGFDLENGI